ncbi:acyltransferase [Chlorociboria aeruginascens]|nr:acyltransferase [Chlorociboria aeruginascens]
MSSNHLEALSNQVADFDLDDGPSNPALLAGYEPEQPPPAPILQSKGILAIDITDQFIDATQKLDIGQLIKDPFFTLFEAVGALEIMDQKMDSGYLEPGETMEDDYNFSRTLLPEEVIGIIDQLLCYEEEDFVTHTYNRDLLENIDHNLILDFLITTADMLAKSESISTEMKSALSKRLKFRATFMRTVEAANTRDESYAFSELKSLWEELCSFLPELKSSAKLGRPVADSFSVKIQRRLASTVPPRPIVMLTQDAAFDHLERLCKDGSIALEVLHYFDSHSLMTFVLLFQARSPQPSVYVRTLLQYYLFGDMIVLGHMSIRQLLDDDFESVVLPASILLDRNNDEVEVTHDPRFNIASRMEIFRSRAAGSVLDILRTICQNRCRIRRTLCHTISDWDQLQLDGEDMDQELRAFTKEEPIINPEISSDPMFSFPLSSWAYFHKLRQMEWIVQMGFELQTYQPDEFAGMYWYLQYLARTRNQHLERIRGFTIRSFSNYRTSSDTSEEKHTQYVNSISFISYSMLEATSTYGFADALSSLFTVLSRLSLIPTPSRPYSDDIMRYELRMKPFSSIGLPEIPPYSEFTETVLQPSVSILHLLTLAADSISGAKKGLEVLSKLSAKDSYSQGSHDSWIANVKNCLKACIFASITIGAVKKAVEGMGKDGKVNIRMEFPETGKGYHAWWVVPKIVSVKS